jgi:hypothetical protein
MTPVLETLALYAPIVVVLAPLAALATLVWRRALGDERALPLADMLVRQGVHADGVWTPGAARQLAVAARRCAACGAVNACRDWLDTGRRGGYEEFCVNAPLIERLK